MSQKDWQQILAAAARILAGAGIEGAARDARWLLAHALKIDRDRLTLVLRDRVETAPLARFDHYMQRRSQREPVSHILGARDFYGQRFMVNGDVLDPRPETELLVEVTLELTPDRVLDLGTGSGCVLLSILAQVPSATGVGCDLSQPALKVAERNANRLGLDGRAAFVHSDWFAQIGDRFDLVVCNPPYISDAEFKQLAPDVTKFEPRMALTPGGDGLGAYRAICAGIMDHLTPGGRLIVEVGPSQATAVAGFFKDSGLEKVLSRNDLDGRARVVVGRANANNSG